jgi:hypothetical protein
MRTARITTAALLIAGLALSAGVQANAASAPDPTVDGIRKELLRLPYYSVFDFMSFKVENGQVTLMGHAYRPSLKSEAEHALKPGPSRPATTRST